MNSLLKNILEIPDGSRIPEPGEYRRKTMELIEELRKMVVFSRAPSSVLWDEPFFSDDGKTVLFRSNFGADGPGAVRFRFNEMARPVSINGDNVEEVEFSPHPLPDALLTKRCKEKMLGFMRYSVDVKDGVKPMWFGARMELMREGPTLRVPTVSAAGQSFIDFVFNSDSDPVSANGEIDEPVSFRGEPEQEWQDRLRRAGKPYEDTYSNAFTKLSP